MKTIAEMLEQLDTEIEVLEKRVINLMVARDSLREVQGGGAVPAPHEAPVKASRRALIADRARAGQDRRCSACGGVGHNKRSCGARAPAES